MNIGSCTSAARMTDFGLGKAPMNQAKLLQSAIDEKISNKKDAISDSMREKINGLASEQTPAVKKFDQQLHAMDGDLQKMQSIAEYASSDSISDEDRQNAEEEFKQLDKDLNSVYSGSKSTLSTIESQDGVHEQADEIKAEMEKLAAEAQSGGTAADSGGGKTSDPATDASQKSGGTTAGSRSGKADDPQSVKEQFYKDISKSLKSMVGDAGSLDVLTPENARNAVSHLNKDIKTVEEVISKEPYMCKKTTREDEGLSNEPLTVGSNYSKSILKLLCANMDAAEVKSVISQTETDKTGSAQTDSRQENTENKTVQS